MEYYEDFIAEAFELVSAWDLPDDALAEAANQQARLMAGLYPDDRSEILSLDI
jgi:hypothetical protein